MICSVLLIAKTQLFKESNPITFIATNTFELLNMQIYALHAVEARKELQEAIELKNKTKQTLI